MTKSRFLLSLLILLTIGQAGLATAQSSSGDTPTAVGLTRFEGFPLENSARIEWETGWEDRTSAFRVRRDNSETGTFDTIIDTIEARGSGDYETIDNTVTNGETYWYKLFEITTSNEEKLACSPDEQHECIFELTIADGIVIDPPGGGDDGDSGSNPTSTSQPTSTPQPTNTPPPTQTTTAGDTPQPTNTPTATTPPQDTTEPTAVNTPIPAGPSPTSFTFPTAAATNPTLPTPEPSPTPTPEDNGFLEIAAVSAQEDPSSDYPAPANDETYPAATNASPAVIGSDNQNEPPAEAIPPTEETPTTSTGNRLFLWLTFAAGLLILIGGIIFSVILAVRRK